MTEPSPPRASPSARLRPYLVGGLGWIRREEWLLIGLWVVGVGLTLSSRTGFFFGHPFQQYLGFFAQEIVYVFAGSRLLFHLEGRWTPRARPARWLKRFLFGEGDGRPSVTEVDLELVRGTLLLFVSLAIYSNVKLKIPLINPAVADSLYADLDAALYLDRLVPVIEGWFRSSPDVADFFGRVYLHDYRYMILLVGLLYLRRDVFHLRLAFVAVCWTYLLAIYMTVALPSYGPCFLEPERFAWLRELDVGKAQAWLAQLHDRVIAIAQQGRDVKVLAFAGIAAFPSLHVGHMVIMGVIAWRTVRPFSFLMAAVATGTFIATIGFGWHYAVDGLGGLALAVGVTHLLMKRMRVWDAARAARPAAATPAADPGST